MKIKAITFDYWDTLVPIEREKIEKMRNKRAKAVTEYLKKRGYDFSYKDVKEISNNIWILYRDNPLINKEVTLYVMVENILKELGISKDKKMVYDIVEIYERFLYSSGLSIDKDIKPVIKNLKRKGYKLGIVSNTPGGKVEKMFLKDANLIDYFDIMLFSSFEGIRKPHPEIFMKVVRFFNIKPSELLHIGDTPELDVEGPLKIGAQVILWDPENKKEFKDIPRIKKWEEIFKFLEDEN